MMPSWQLPQHPKGPAVWQVEHKDELAEVLGLLLAEPLHRHSQGHAAVQGAAKIADSMMTIAWEVLVIMVLDPALTGLKTNSIVHGPPQQAAAEPLLEGGLSEEHVAGLQSDIEQ